MASEEPVPVDLYIYDLTYGLASVLSPAIVGQQVEGVWHTAVVVYDREFFYGQDGVTSCPPGSTQLGAPHKIERLGDTFVPFQVLVDYLQGLATSTYRGSEYHLLRHNCNHFSEEVAGFLCGAHIPKHILAQPDALPPALRTALEATLTQMLPHPTQAVYADGVRHSRRDSPDFLTLNNQIEEARVQTAELDKRRATLADKLARRERRREKKRKKLNGTIDQVDPELDIEEAGMAEAVEALPGGSGVVEAGAGAGVNLGGGSLQERRDEEARRRTAYPPIVYKDIDVVSEFEKLAKELEGGKLSETETQSLDELRQYLVHGEGSWVLGDEFLDFIGAVLLESRFSQSARICVLRCLAGAALRDDAALLLHQDRRRHALLSHAYNIDTLPIEEQRAVLLFMCNLFESISSSEWLLYISEWEDVTGRPLSNIRVTTKVCVHGVVSEEEALRELGTALLHNLAGKERLGATRALRELLPKHAKSRVFDEVCVELAMAALQLLGGGGGAGGSGGAGAAVSEEHAYRATRALAGLAVRAQDVPMVIQMVGPSPDAYRGTSQRVDEQIDLIMKTLK